MSQQALAAAAGVSQSLVSEIENNEYAGSTHIVQLARHYIVDTAGELHRNPTFARGVIRALDDELGRRVWND